MIVNLTLLGLSQWLPGLRSFNLFKCVVRIGVLTGVIALPALIKLSAIAAPDVYATGILIGTTIDDPLWLPGHSAFTCNPFASGHSADTTTS